MQLTLKRIQTTACLATLGAALLLTAGCKSSGYEQGNKTAANIQATADRIAALSGQIDKTMASLNDMVTKPAADLRPQYKQFAANVSEVLASGKEIKAARLAMGNNQKEFFAKWDAEFAQIKNEDIKARSQSRKQEVADKMLAVKTSYSEAEETAKPFISDLQDIQKYLSQDLTAGGVAAIKDTAAKATKEADALKVTIGKVSESFKALGLSMSSVTPQQPAK